MKNGKTTYIDKTKAGLFGTHYERRKISIALIYNAWKVELDQ